MVSQMIKECCFAAKDVSPQHGGGLHEILVSPSELATLISPLKSLHVLYTLHTVFASRAIMEVWQVPLY